uniref:Uncharacterized protein n=1 Tax=Timema bartmani TaxID=61472 RepID=A0A7R9FBL4_9NEOP|nr:unnamed protein product [Timema bartmani]
MSPSSLSSRTTLLFLFLASLFLFTSYSANIVALLQTPGTNIKTVTDLANSPLTLGFEEMMYNRESTDPTISSLYALKVAHQGESTFYKNVSKGISKMRQGMFGFQVESNIGYKEISNTFTERKKCGLAQIEIFPLSILAMAVSRKSPLKEIFAVR